MPENPDPPGCLTPVRGHRALRENRYSCPEGEYFITVNLDQRGHGLEAPEVRDAVMDKWDGLTSRGIWHLRTGVVMPDHVHMDFVLGRETELAEAMRQFKGSLTPILRRAGLHWQKGYYERQLRSTDDRLPVFRYIFLNPYEARLIAVSEKWPGYFCRAEDWAWFGELTDRECPFPEWLSR